MAFDGTYIWVANNSDSTVTRLRAADGKSAGNFPAGPAPHGVASDGANIWVADYGHIMKLSIDGTQLGSFAVT